MPEWLQLLLALLWAAGAAAAIWWGSIEVVVMAAFLSCVLGFAIAVVA